MASQSLNLAKALAARFPWTTNPFIVSAPMRGLSSAELAVAVSNAGGLGFIGPRPNPKDWTLVLDKVRDLATKARNTTSSGSQLARLPPDYALLPIGIGFQVWTDDLAAATATVQQHKPCVVWLFAPRNGQAELDEWSRALRDASPDTEIWIQIGTVAEAREIIASSSPPAVVVVQGAEAGGHGRATDGMALTTLLPEIAELFRKEEKSIPLLAAGGIVDGRGAAAALCLGASGVVMGTRFLNAVENNNVPAGYQQEIIRVQDAATSTTRTQLYNHLRGITTWPEQWSPRAIINRTFRDHQAGVPFDELKKLHDEAAKSGSNNYGPDGRLGAYVGAGVDLIHDIKNAEAIVKDTQTEAASILRALSSSIS